MRWVRFDRAVLDVTDDRDWVPGVVTLAEAAWWMAGHMVERIFRRQGRPRYGVRQIVGCPSMTPGFAAECSRGCAVRRSADGSSARIGSTVMSSVIGRGADCRGGRVRGRGRTMSEPELIDVVGGPAMAVRGVVPMAGLREFFDASFAALGQTAAAQDVALLSPAFGRYRGLPGATVDVEVGFLTGAPVAADGSVVPRARPGGRAARLVHEGGFDGLGRSWERLGTWLSEQGLTPADERWEFYVTRPEPDMDPVSLRTELVWPLG
jgi:effector-binding domain-containing protein